MKPYDIEAEEKFIAGQYSREKDFWLAKLSGDLEKTSFPYDFERRSKNERRMDSLGYEFPEALAAKLIAASGDSDSRLHMILVAGFIQLLGKYTGSDDIIIGTPIYRQEVEGDFVNTMLILRNPLDTAATFKDLLIQVRQTIIEANEHVNYPVEIIPHELGMSYSEEEDFPLFDVIVSLENIHDKKYIRHIHSNLIFTFSRTGSRLKEVVAYNSCLYARSGVERINKYFVYLLGEAIFNANTALHRISVLPAEEKQEILYGFNRTHAEYPAEMTIRQLFEKQVEAVPDVTAVVDGSEHVTYHKLNRAANGISSFLMGKGVEVNTIVGIMGKRSIAIIAGILGILKAGGTYLPINARDPEDRIKFILEDSKTPLLITQEHLLADNPSFLAVDSLKSILLFEELAVKVDEPQAYEGYQDRQCLIKPDDHMYLIYTSGTTGKPKGVPVTHRSVINYTWWAGKKYIGNEKVNFPLYTSIAFDLTVTSIFTPLITGNAVVVYGGEGDEPLIETVINENRVEAVKLTPSHLKLIRDNTLDGRVSSIKRFILGGEALETRLAKEIHENFNGNIEIYNEYGPTETTVGSMIYRFDPREDNRKWVPIGRPVANTQVYLLNRNLEPVPVGAEGEIFISGDGVAVGYLYRPGLTGERFVPNPFIEGKKMYRTGDMARQLEDGNMEFLGRRDNQVKIRGYRVETGEIENCLLAHQDIKEVVVISKGDETSGFHLCAYIVSREEIALPVIREYLSRSLPDYMIPSYFVTLDRIPLTQNGKVDRRALPEPRADIGNKYIPPRHGLDRKLVNIWAEILDIDENSLSIDADFFEVGGHSLNATVLTARIHKAFDVRVPLDTIFRNATIRGLAEFLKGAVKELFVSIEPAEEREYYALSSAQKRFFVLHRMEPDSTAYNIPIFVLLSGCLEKEKMEETFGMLAKRHESLRTYFELIGDEPVQRVHRKVTTGVEYYEPGSVETPGVTGEIIENFSKPFNLFQAPLMRMGLVRVEEERHILMVDIHHIVSDALSMELILRDFIAFYAGEVLPGLKIDYKDYAEWQNKKREKQIIKKQEDFWLREFAGEIPVLDLPTDFSRPVIQCFDGNEIRFEIGKKETGRLNRLASENGATLFMILLALYNILLAKLSNQEDIVIGTPVAGRGHADLEPVLGLFINTLALRNYPKGEKTFKEFLHELKERSVDAFDNQHYSFEDLVEKTAVNRDVSRNPLFDVMFYWNYITISDMQIPGLKVEPYHYENKTSKFDLTLEGMQIENKLAFRFEYAARLFKKSAIERFISYFKKIVSSVNENPGGKISGIEVISEEEKRQVLYDFNDKEAFYPGKPIHRLFEEQAEKTPDSPAIIFGEKQLTYGVLNRESYRLAAALGEKGVKPGTIVGIMVERSIEMVVGIFGILKAGGAYLPIDPDYPGERITYILDDSSAAILLTTPGLSEKLSIVNCQLLIVNEKPSNSRRLNNPPKEANSINNYQLTINNSQLKGNNLAYIIYTSGSTGKPKGVMVEHSSAVNILIALQREYPLEESDTYLLKTSYLFDVSVTELFGWFTGGGRLSILETGGEKDPKAIMDEIERAGVTHINFVPSLFNVFVEGLKPQHIEKLSSLKYIFLAGEALLPGLVERFRHLNTGIPLENIYGPTEGTIYSSKYSLSRWNGSGSIPIGKPLRNISLFVLDKDNHLQPIGVPGELCIGGAGVARGYLNRPGLTAEKFVEIEVKVKVEEEEDLAAKTREEKKVPGERIYMSHMSHMSYIYRTGDLVRWLPTGDIEFFGRRDHQVKIRGFRVELGEIESQLQGHDKIKEAVVISKTDDKRNNYLAAYVTTLAAGGGDFNLNTADLRDYLLQRLPHYMVPSYFVKLDKLPLTPSGKIDRRSLPDPKESGLDSGGEYLAARTLVEEKLVETWENILGRNNLGTNDDFFVIGGDSIKAIQVAARMNKLGYKLEMRDIFRSSTISKLAPLVKKEERIPDQSVISGAVPLVPIQKWFFESKSADLHHYNFTVILHTKEVLEEKGVRAIFAKIQEHHDSLRMTFKKVGIGIFQTNHGVEYPLSLEVVDYRNMDRENAAKALENRANDIQVSLDLEKGPLMKVGLFHLDDGDRLLIVIHHLVIDGVSWRILLEDIESLYRQYKNGDPFALPSKTDSFKLWAEKLSAYADSEEFLKIKPYWAGLESLTVEPIRKDFEEEDNYVKDAEVLSFRLSEGETKDLISKVNFPFGTEINDILLTALGSAIKKTWGLNRFLTTLEGHGREEILKDININRTVGWFTSMYPVILNMSYDNDLSRQIKEVKESLRQVPHKGVGYGILRYLTAERHKQGLEFKLKPQVSFNYLGQFDVDLDQTSFRGAGESVGELISLNQKRKCELELSGVITNNRLELKIVFNKRQYRTETIETFLEQYKASLGHIISYCSAREEREYTPSDFTYKELSIENVDQLACQYPLEDLYPLSPLQVGILFHAVNTKDTSTYLIQIAFHIHGNLHIGLMEKSLNELFKRHDILRTAFVYEGPDRPLQIVVRNREVEFYYEDIRAKGSTDEKNAFIKEYREKERQRSFDLSRDVLMRAAVIQTGQTDYELIWSFHHILLDGWSIGILSSEFLAIYHGFLQNRNLQLPPVVPFRTYIQWLEERSKEFSKEYWQKYLEGYEEKVGLPGMESVNTHAAGYNRETVVVTIEREHTGGLVGLASRHHVTLSTVFQVLWGILLGKYRGKPETDVVFGVVVSGRPPGIENVESMVGLFINTIPVRIQYKESTTFKDLLQKVQKRAIECEPHHYSPLTEILSGSVLKQDLFDHILAFENFPDEKKLAEMINKNEEDKTVSALEFSNIEAFVQTHYDFDISIIPGEMLEIRLAYNSNVYEEELIEKLGEHFLNLLIQVIDKVEGPIKELELSVDGKRGKMLQQFMDEL